MHPSIILVPESELFLYTVLPSIKDAGQGLFTAINIYRRNCIDLYRRIIKH